MPILKSSARALLIGLMSLPWSYANADDRGKGEDDTPEEKTAKLLRDKALFLREECGADKDVARRRKLTALREAITILNSLAADPALGEDLETLADEKVSKAAIKGALRRAEALLQRLRGGEPNHGATTPEGAPDGITRAESKLETARADVGELLAASGLCEFYCDTKSENGGDGGINICALADDLPLARVAVAIDPEAVEDVLEIFSTAAQDAVAVAGDPAPEPDRRGGRLLAPASMASMTSLNLGEEASDLAIRLAVGLGKLAVDRAKQEAVLWSLDQLNREFCGHSSRRPGGEKDLLTSEVRTYWLPRLCDLSLESKRASGFGAGAAMFTALLSAVENDARGFPGAAAGLAVGAAFWADESSWTKSTDSLFSCETSSETASETPQDEACVRVRSVREATSQAITGLLDGDDPIAQAWRWAETLNSANRVANADSRGQGAEAKHTLAAPWAQVAACGVSIAASLSGDEPGEARPIDYRALAAMVSTPACWTLTGKGFSPAELSDCGASTQSCTVRYGLDWSNPGEVERLSTVLRIGALLAEKRRRLLHAWRSVARADARLRRAREHLKEVIKGRKSAETTKTEAFAAVAKLRITELDRDGLRQLLDEAKADAANVHRSALLDVAEELVAVADATASLVEHISTEAECERVWPGLGAANLPCAPDDLGPALGTFRRQLAGVDEVLDALRDLLAGDWANAMMRAFAIVPRTSPTEDKACEKKRSTAAKLPADVVARLGELVGLFTALLSAEKSEDVAVILEKTASPPGGWRRKQAKGATTLSIAGHVGVMAAAEFRVGQYGVTRERGGAYLQAPTLSVPIGFDLAWGTGAHSLGFFAPVIDPAAFLHYDVSEGGRLPGPRPITALAPGLLLRLGLRHVPLTVLAGYIYRPRLRTWEATVQGPGADAHQLGVSLAIDATLWNILKR